MTQTIDAITKEVLFHQPIDTLWQAITRPEELSRWFGSAAHFELKEGASGYFEWQEDCEGRFAIQIQAIRAPHYFSWRWMHDPDVPFEQQSSTLVEWDLTQISDGETRLELTESGFSDVKHRSQNVEGWDQELGDLIQYFQ